MYISALTVVLGEAWLFMSAPVAVYLLLMAAVFHSFVVLYEEPTLIANVWRDLPRLSPHASLAGYRVCRGHENARRSLQREARTTADYDRLRAACLRSMTAMESLMRAERVGVDSLVVGLRHEAVEHVGDQSVENGRVGHEELRLVVVADQRQAALQHAPVVDMRNLRREVVALDAVGVVQEVERVVDRQSESGAPGDQALVDLGLDVDLGDLVEHLGRDGQQAHQRRAGAAPSITCSERSSVNTSESKRGLT